MRALGSILRGQVVHLTLVMVIASSWIAAWGAAKDNETRRLYLPPIPLHPLSGVPEGRGFVSDEEETRPAGTPLNMSASLQEN